jgi:hypothetical protein
MTYFGLHLNQIYCKTHQHIFRYSFCIIIIIIIIIIKFTLELTTKAQRGVDV